MPQHTRRIAARTSSSPFARLIWLLDLKFERYLTPWIIRFTWLWTIVLILAGWSLYTAIGLYQVMPRRTEVQLSIPLQIEEEMRAISRLIAMKEWEDQQRTPRGGQQPPEPREEYSPGPETAERPDPLEKYKSMSLGQLKSELERLKKQYPESEKRLTWNKVALAFYSTSVVGSVLSSCLFLLALRVVCELVIVIFNVASTLSEIKAIIGRGDSNRIGG